MKMLSVKRFQRGILKANGYVLYYGEGGECYIIDPGYDPNAYVCFVRKNNLKPLGIIATHMHSDHVGAAPDLAKVLYCPFYMHEDDANSYVGKVDERISEKNSFKLGGETIKVIHTPGHTKGGICLMAVDSKICFTGDTIFDTDLGRTDLTGGSEDEMAKTIRDICDKWPDDVFIYPGHEDGCTMSYVRRVNKEYIALRDGRSR